MMGAGASSFSRKYQVLVIAGILLSRIETGGANGTSRQLVIQPSQPVNTVFQRVRRDKINILWCVFACHSYVNVYYSMVGKIKHGQQPYFKRKSAGMHHMHHSSAFG